MAGLNEADKLNGEQAGRCAAAGLLDAAVPAPGVESPHKT